jgi:hypothetical protein
VAVKILCPGYEMPKMVGKHFTVQDELYNKVNNLLDVYRVSSFQLRIEF